MKKLLPLFAIMFVAGCSHSPAKAPENYSITETSHECDGNSCRIVTRTDHVVVSVRQLPPPKVQGQIVSTEVDDNPYEEEPAETRHTWMTPEDIQKAADDRLMKAMEAAVKRDSCLCQPGDPLCSCL